MDWRWWWSCGVIWIIFMRKSLMNQGSAVVDVSYLNQLKGHETPRGHLWWIRGSNLKDRSLIRKNYRWTWGSWKGQKVKDERRRRWRRKKCTKGQRVGRAWKMKKKAWDKGSSCFKSCRLLHRSMMNQDIPFNKESPLTREHQQKWNVHVKKHLYPKRLL